MLIQRELVSLCSELRSTQMASSRVSCNHCGALNFDFSNETSDLHFAHGQDLVHLLLSALLLLFAVKALPIVPTHTLASHERQHLCRTTRCSQPSTESSLGCHLVLNRFLLFSIDSRCDLSHRHLVSTLNPSETSSRVLSIFFVLIFDPSASSSRILYVFLAAIFDPSTTHVLISVFVFDHVHPSRSS